MTGVQSFGHGTFARPGAVGLSVAFTNGALFSDATYYYVAYKNVGTFSNDLVIANGTLTAEILCIGGGGGGGTYTASSTTTSAGGGGAGQVLKTTGTLITPGAYSITVGSGGALATNGGTTSIGSFATAVGGGGGGGTVIAKSGASGGGGSNSLPTAGTATAGFAGGAGKSSGGSGSQSGGGGGGAGGVGNPGTSTLGGAGGSGVQYLDWATAIGELWPIGFTNSIGDDGYFAGGGGSLASAQFGQSARSLGEVHHGSGGLAGGPAYSAINAAMFYSEGKPGYQGLLVIRYTRSQVGG